MIVAKTALAVAAALLARREHTRRELTQKLARRFTAADIKTALDHLEEKNLLSERRFACSYVREAGKKFGNARLRRYLKERAVAEQDIEYALTTELSTDECTRAGILLNKKYRTALTDPKTRAQAMRFLLSRGFAAAIAMAAVNAHQNQEE